MKSCCPSPDRQMANSPVDRNEEIMLSEHGTRCLITDLAAEKYLAQSAKYGTERFSKWCGGKGGFDDYCERVH